MASYGDSIPLTRARGSTSAKASWQKITKSELHTPDSIDSWTSRIFFGVICQILYSATGSPGVKANAGASLG